MWFRNLFDSLKAARCRTPIQRARRGSPRRQPATGRLAVETLEDRCVPTAMFSVGDVTVLEANAGAQNALVTVSLTEPHGNSVTVSYNTANGTASAGSDYNSVSGKLTFAKSEMSKTILVPVIGDRVPEPNENFFVRLSNAKGAKIADAEGMVAITDNEPRISINDVSVMEGNSGTTPFAFTVTLSAPSDLPVTVNYTIVDGAASAGSDYTAPASGTLTFEPDQPLSQTITGLVNGDRLFEQNEAFIVNLSNPDSHAEIGRGTGYGTIIEDDPQIGIAEAYNYGDYSPFTFAVSLSAASTEWVMVDFTTVDGTAFAGVDYVFNSGTVTFEPGVTTMYITVDVIDPTYADNKYFTVQLSNATSNALLTNEGATGWWYYYDPGYYDPGYGYGDYGYYYGDYYGYY